MDVLKNERHNLKFLDLRVRPIARILRLRRCLKRFGKMNSLHTFQWCLSDCPTEYWNFFSLRWTQVAVFDVYYRTELVFCQTLQILSLHCPIVA